MVCNSCLNSLENDSWSVIEKKVSVALVIAWMSLANTLVKEDILQTQKTPLRSFLLIEKWSTVTVGLGMYCVLEK